MGDGPRDNAEAKTLAPWRPESPRVAQGNQDMIEGRHLFQSGKGAASELPQTLDFGSLANLYGTDNLRASDRTLLAQATDGQNHPAESAIDVWYHQPIVEAQKLQHEADELVKNHKISPYSAEVSTKGFPKCNVFVYDAMGKAGVPLPHGERGERLTASQLDQALSHDQNFEKVWARHQDESQWKRDAERFLKTFRPQDGDIAIWNNRYLEHTGILEETLNGHGNTFYAGRETPSGVGHTNLDQFWITSPTKGYGAPDAVYRYKHFVR